MTANIDSPCRAFRHLIAVAWMAAFGALPPFTGTSAKDPLPPMADIRLGTL
jgi:hypothetical protein